MANPSGRKGAWFEDACVNYMRTQGIIHAYRDHTHGGKDVGDIGGIPGIVHECKNHARLALPQAMREAEVEAGHAGADLAYVIHHRPGAGEANMGRQWVTTTLELHCHMLRGLVG